MDNDLLTLFCILFLGFLAIYGRAERKRRKDWPEEGTIEYRGFFIKRYQDHWAIYRPESAICQTDTVESAYSVINAYYE